MKGKGADLFLEESDKKDKSLKKKKVTLYLYPSVADKLDDVWLTLKSQDKKVSKSKIAEIGISRILKEYEEEGQESTLFKYFLG